ncbi:NAD(P)-dependent dehydrogenase (short-subunit alcohol dehydrogenase family) [Paraburkholderia silvatlantica]|uniref:Probable oxidoreductase n=1 Tax=Paraburkholderia silvatlantica TaxID=321895 RepID=A0A2V4TP09_9BURK|nr:oxidoreductase [Paraburkholderia silvatlantica]PYE18407.1 NAD(P)-dependent dehydrogenase (short-subunit alcohol dehydrogenase family) [Paraburkholderia silvatlantica]
MTTSQTPIDSGFGFASTADDVIAGIDLSGKSAIVTGGYSGIGAETTRVLAKAGATVIVPARDLDKACKALNGIAHVEFASLDLLEPNSVDAFADVFEKSGRPLHLLVNNAGVMATPLMHDGKGYELQLSANHIGHFRLAVRLWPALCRADGARVVALSSGAHRWAAFDFDDPHFRQHEYDRWIAYAQAKTATALFAVELDRRGKGDGIRSFSVHPGRIETGLQRHISLADLQALGFRNEQGEIPAEQRHMYKSTAQGAATTVWCATSPTLKDQGGVYCENCDIAAAVEAGHKEMNGVLPWARDAQAAQQLWVLSETWIT